MASVINFDAPRTSSSVITSATGNGAYGRAHSKLDNAAGRLFKKDEFTLNGAGYETRTKKFTKTFVTMEQASASAGVLVGTVLMTPVDLLTGRGDVRPEGEKSVFMDEGVLGNGGRFLTALGSGAGEVLGAGIGGVGSLISYPTRGATKNSSAEYFEAGAAGGAVGVGKIAAHVFGTSTGVILDGVRAPSLVVRAGLGAVAAVAALPVSLATATIRAATNK